MSLCLAVTAARFPWLASTSTVRSMENELTFVAPEGVYSLTEEHKPTILNPHIIAPPIYPTRLVTCVVRFPAVRHASGPGLPIFSVVGRTAKRRRRIKTRRRSCCLSRSGRMGRACRAAEIRQTRRPIPIHSHHLSCRTAHQLHPLMILQSSLRLLLGRPRRNLYLGQSKT